MSTHIEAMPGQIAKTVIMPGDPKRAQYMASKFLEDPQCVSSVRGILAYTGTYKGKELTIIASGMGIPSMGIYAYELYHNYNVEAIIRVGSIGAYSPNLELYDVVLTSSAYSDSSFLKVQQNSDEKLLEASADLNEKLRESARGLNIKLKEGIVYTSDVFYKKEEDYQQLAKERELLGVEMEAFGLFATAKLLNKKAACLLTVSNHFVTGAETSSKERELAFSEMFEIALNINES